MKESVCKNCGSNDLYDENGYRICRYCGTKFLLTSEDRPERSSSIELNSDVQRLLKKCQEDPGRAKKYAQLILEIDPNNIEAKRILTTNQNVNTSAGGCYIATAVYGSYDCPEVWTLRRFRDNRLALSWYGRAFIKLYYAISPTLVRLFGKTRWFKAVWQKPLDKLVNRLKESGYMDTPYYD